MEHLTGFFFSVIVDWEVIMFNVINFSGGRDSTAMLLRLVEIGYKIDEIRFFDEGSWGWDAIRNNVKRVEAYIKREIKVFHPLEEFDYLFSEKVVSRGARAGIKGYGWPNFSVRWCSGIKRVVLERGLEKSSSVIHIGFTTEEIKRVNRFTHSGFMAKFPLVEWDWSKGKVAEYCDNKGFKWEGLYKIFNSLSCWCCPLQRLDDLRALRKYHPGKWERLLEMGTKTDKGFKREGKTPFSYERKFHLEERRMLVRNRSNVKIG